MRLKIPAPQTVSRDTTAGWSYYCWVVRKVLSLHQTSSDATLMEKFLGALLQLYWGGSLAHWPFAGMDRNGVSIFWGVWWGRGIIV